VNLTRSFEVESGLWVTLTGRPEDGDRGRNGFHRVDVTFTFTDADPSAAGVADVLLSTWCGVREDEPSGYGPTAADRLSWLAMRMLRDAWEEGSGYWSDDDNADEHAFADNYWTPIDCWVSDNEPRECVASGSWGVGAQTREAIAYADNNDMVSDELVREWQALADDDESTDWGELGDAIERATDYRLSWGDGDLFFYPYRSAS
jgi:hypothetical protein